MIGEKVQGEELKRWLEGIAAFNATPGEGMTRGVYTPEFQDARRYVKNVMIALGLEVSEDCLGNIFGVYPGTDPDVAPVWTGSHIDTVPNGGKYDGLAGVFAGLEAVAAMIRAEVQPKRAISVNVYAGGTSMADRRDAFMAAAEMSLALERLAQTSDSAYITGTVGEMQLTPGAANVIPGKAEFSVDVRSVSGDDKSQLVELWTEEAKAVAARRDVDLDITPLNDDAPLTCDPHFGDVIREQADALKISHMDLISGPYHDSLMLGDLMPAAMVFIPCQGGISHDRKEAIDLDDLVKGTAVLAESLYQIANE